MKEQIRINLKKEKMLSKNQMVTQKQENCEKFIENLSKYAKIKELNRYILNQVIDKIYVYDQEEVDGELKQEVEIHYKFIGKIN